jgi:hypothetical protein
VVGGSVVEPPVVGIVTPAEHQRCLTDAHAGWPPIPGPAPGCDCQANAPCPKTDEIATQAIAAADPTNLEMWRI